MKAESPKASILVPATLTPAAAAARSLPRTVRNRRPVPERRTFTTTRARSTTKIRHSTPNHTFGGTTSVARMPNTLSLTLFGPKSFPPILGGGTGERAGRAGQLRVLEDELLDGDRRRERDDGQVDAPHAEGGHGDGQPEQRRDQRRHDRTEREGPVAEVLGQREAGRPRDRALGQRDLPDEPGQHHQRQRDHREDEGVDDGLAPVEAEAEQPDERGRDGQHGEGRHVAGRRRERAGGHRRSCPARAGSCPARTWR